MKPANLNRMKNPKLYHQILELADGTRSSSEIAEILGVASRNVRKYMTRYDMPRLAEGARHGESNHQYQSGRRITLNGYVLITPPQGHLTAKARPGRKAGYMFEHRYVMEQKLGRPLESTERVDHVNGLTLHNHPDNLRLFSSNAEHLKATLTGKCPTWSEQGHANMLLRHRQPEDLERVDTHYQRTAAGATRLRQILLAAYALGTDSPYLSGSLHWLEQAHIDYSTRPKIGLALVALCSQWGWPHPQL